MRTYNSSVDGVVIQYLEYVPAGYVPTRPYPVLAYLHGGGGTMNSIPSDILASADVYQYIVVSINGRSLYPSGTRPSALYFNSPITGPGEQDVLDMLADVKRLRLIDDARVYLAGFSKGGWGTWGIALRNPGIFAAIAPASAPTDGHYVPELHDFNTALGGAPSSTDPVVISRWRMIGARWLIDNAMNTPVHAFHGDLDKAANNVPTSSSGQPQYAHAHHVIDLPGWVDEWGQAVTLLELAQQYPGYYIGEGTWVPTAGHSADAAIEPPSIMFEFFNQHTLDPSPLQIAFKTYEDEHTRAYWGQIEIANPWSTEFGAFRASRDALGNSLSVELSRVAKATFDLPRAELTVAPGNTFTLLLATTAPLTTTIVLNDDLTNVANATVLRDGTPVTAGLVNLTDTTISIGPLTVDAPTVLTIWTTSPTTDAEPPAAPARFRLRLAGPNPAPDGPGSAVAFDVPAASLVRVEVFDVRGRRLGTLYDGVAQPGTYVLGVPGAIARGARGGVCFVRMKAGDFEAVQRIVLVP